MESKKVVASALLASGLVLLGWNVASAQAAEVSAGDKSVTAKV